MSTRCMSSFPIHAGTRREAGRSPWLFVSFPPSGRENRDHSSRNDASARHGAKQPPTGLRGSGGKEGDSVGRVFTRAPENLGGDCPLGGWRGASARLGVIRPARAAGAGGPGEKRIEGIHVHGLEQVMIEARFLRAAAVFGTA